MTKPTSGAPITMGAGNKLNVPDNPIIPFIEGDGTGRDIWRASVRVLDASVAKAYGGKRAIAWHEVLAGEKAFKTVNNWLPDETVEAFRTYLVASWVCLLPWSIGAIVLGRGFMSGNFKLAATGLGLLVAAVALVNALRHRYASKSR